MQISRYRQIIHDEKAARGYKFPCFGLIINSDNF